MVLRANAGRLLVHQIASDIANRSADVARAFRGPGAYERGDQLVRAAVSVSSNIAEACGRGTVAEFRRFLIYARGSAHELRSQLQLARRMDPDQAARFRSLESQTTLVIKLLGRLHDHPPPDR
jgi:four helix bundle protein